jgi:hypothetical protein
VDYASVLDRTADVASSSCMSFSRNFSLYDNLSDANSAQQHSKQEESWFSDGPHNSVVINMDVCKQRCTHISGCGLLLCSEISSPSVSGVYLHEVHDKHDYVYAVFADVSHCRVCMKMQVLL